MQMYRICIRGIKCGGSLYVMRVVCPLCGGVMFMTWEKIGEIVECEKCERTFKVV